ncbi:MAG: TaqI-like C-terminal specificity domain-containing protein [Bacteroidia bacterium]
MKATDTIEIFIDNVTQVIEPVKKDFGIFFTPNWIVDLMVNLIDETKFSNKKNIAILEPACGLTQFLTGIKRNKPKLYIRAKKFGVEINKDIYENLTNKESEIIYADYLLWQTEQKFDIIIGNPPYGIPSLSEHYTIKVNHETKNLYKKNFSTWYGKYNVYGAFIEKSIQLLKENGELIFITPATFTFLDEFKKLREFLAKNGDTEIIYMGEEVFKPNAFVTSVILKFTKGKNIAHNLLLAEFENGQTILHKKISNWQGEIITFKSSFTEEMKKICKHYLSDIYEIRISPRTPEIKKNKFIVRDKNLVDENYIPILNGRNLKVNEIIYEPLNEHWIHKSKINTLRGYFNQPHIVVALGFRGDRQIAAAFDKKSFPWMGDVYHLIRKNSFAASELELSDEEVVTYLNSEVVRKYLIDTFKEVTYHLSITQLKQIPIPISFKDLKKLSEIYA